MAERKRNSRYGSSNNSRSNKFSSFPSHVGRNRSGGGFGGMGGNSRGGGGGFNSQMMMKMMSMMTNMMQGQGNQGMMNMMKMMQNQMGGGNHRGMNQFQQNQGMNVGYGQNQFNMGNQQNFGYQGGNQFGGDQGYSQYPQQSQYGQGGQTGGQEQAQNDQNQGSQENFQNDEQGGFEDSGANNMAVEQQGNNQGSQNHPNFDHNGQNQLQSPPTPFNNRGNQIPQNSYQTQYKSSQKSEIDIISLNDTPVSNKTVSKLAALSSQTKQNLDSSGLKETSSGHKNDSSEKENSEPSSQTKSNSFIPPTIIELSDTTPPGSNKKNALAQIENSLEKTPQRAEVGEKGLNEVKKNLMNSGDTTTSLNKGEVGEPSGKASSFLKAPEGAQGQVDAGSGAEQQAVNDS